MYSELLNGNYSVCHFCKEGKFIGELEEETDLINDIFFSKHIEHNSLDIITAVNFLSKNLVLGYIDINRLNLLPIITEIGRVDRKDILEEYKRKKKTRNRFLSDLNKKEEIKNDILQDYLKTSYCEFYIFPKPYFKVSEFTKEEWLIPQNK